MLEVLIRSPGMKPWHVTCTWHKGMLLGCHRNEMVLISICNIFWCTFDFVYVVRQKLIWKIVTLAAKFGSRKVELIIHTVCHHFNDRERISCVLPSVLHLQAGKLSVSRRKIFTLLVQEGVLHVCVDRYGGPCPGRLHDGNGSIIGLSLRHFLSAGQSTAIGKIILASTSICIDNFYQLLFLRRFLNRSQLRLYL